MPRAKRQSLRKPWTPAEIKKLKSLAGRLKLAALAKTLKRTPMAARRKATQQGISLAMR